MSAHPAYRRRQISILERLARLRDMDPRALAKDLALDGGPVFHEYLDDGVNPPTHSIIPSGKSQS